VTCIQHTKLAFFADDYIGVDRRSATSCTGQEMSVFGSKSLSRDPNDFFKQYVELLSAVHLLRSGQCLAFAYLLMEMCC